MIRRPPRSTLFPTRRSSDLTVTSKSHGETIPGVNVLIKGSMTGTVTDIDGNYSLDVPEDGTLIFSSIGYATLEISIYGRSEEHTSELQSQSNLVCRLLLEKK